MRHTGSSAPLPPDTTAADADSNDEHFEYERCDNPACEFHSGHTGPCSDQYVSSRTRGAHARGGVNHDAGEYVRIVLDNFCFDVLKADLAIGEIKIPKSYDEALASLQRSEWEAAMSKELSGITANETWDLIIAHDGKYFDWFCKKFQQRFNTTEPVKFDWFLGIGVDQHDG